MTIYHSFIRLLLMIILLITKPFRMSIPLPVIRRLVLVIHSLVNEYLSALDHVIINGRLNHNALRHVELSLTRLRRDDVLEIIRQTMAGKDRKDDCWSNIISRINYLNQSCHRHRSTKYAFEVALIPSWLS
jgi:hypothetical protein